MSYTGGSISAGKVVVEGNVTFSDSSSHTAALTAVQINTTSLYANEINADFFNYNALDVSGNLSVSGLTTLNNLEVTGTANINNLAFTSATIAELSVTNELLGPNGFSIDLSGNLVVPGTLIVDGNTTLNGITLEGDTTLGSLVVTGTSSLESLDVSGNVSVLGNTSLDSLNVNIATISSLDVTGASFLESLDVSGNVSVLGNTSLDSLDVNIATISSLVVTGTSFLESLDVSGNVTAKTLTADKVTTGFVDTSGIAATVIIADALTAQEIITYNLDVSGNAMVTGTAEIGSAVINELLVTSDALFEKNVNITENVYLGANEYIAGNVYVNNGINVGDGSNNLPGIVLFNGVITTPGGFSTDGSGNVLAKSFSVPAGKVIDVSGNVTAKTLTADKVTTGFVDTSGIAATLIIADALRTDALITYNLDVSGNAVVSGSAEIETLIGTGNAQFDKNVNVTENIAAANEYLSGSIYANDGVLIGDSSDNNAVQLLTLNQTLLVKGEPVYTTDASGVISGPFDSSDNITVSSAAFNVNATGTIDTGFTLSTLNNFTDSSNQIINLIDLAVDASNNSQIYSNGGNTPPAKLGDAPAVSYLPIYINGQIWYVRLYGPYTSLAPLP